MEREGKRSKSSARFEAEQLCRGEVRPFKSDGEVLEFARILFRLRQKQNSPDDQQSYREMVTLERALSRRLHSNLKASSNKLYLAKVFKQQRLNRLEREIVLFLSLASLGMFNESGMRHWGNVRIADVQDALNGRGPEKLAVVRALSDNSRLNSSGIVGLDHDEVPANKVVQVSCNFLSPLVKKGKSFDNSWKVKSYEELLDKLYMVVKCLQRRGECISSERRNAPWASHGAELETENRRVLRHIATLMQTLRKHPRWPLSRALKKELRHQERLMLLVLLGKDLGFFERSSDLFTGDGLVLTASDSVPRFRHNLELLKGHEPLRKQGYIQVCGGLDSGLVTEDETTLKNCEFELTDEFLERLKVKRKRKSGMTAREPLMKMEQLVLHDDVIEALSLAEAQFRHAEVLLKDWGLAGTVTYGRGVALLFWGPPGVGKTAAAEALAHKLGKRIIAANYAEIQSCWVGQTEKNIVKAFREAREANAVLFWDEADGMFYDRDSAVRNWEVRDVNVLLQEIEKFSGLCILSTNRQVTLDKALERRIAIKVQFRKPDREMALQIWKKMTPKKLPLARDVDFGELADADLTGGEIKNVLLNAARFALCRSPKAKVMMSDLRKAVSMERSGKWSGRTGPIGFCTK
jgi:SpoVK/Ycf46/Vps4 family AAA+-type ATPase